MVALTGQENDPDWDNGALLVFYTNYFVPGNPRQETVGFYILIKTPIETAFSKGHP